MKKLFVMGVAALAFVSCSKNMGDFSTNGYTNTKQDADADVAKYENAFVEQFGIPAADQTWGFGTMNSSSRAMARRANAGVDYPATSGHINANGNEWAALTTGSNPKTYGGWVVPDPLTEEQKNIVKAYFQANPNLTYNDPEWRHFFIQQVYKGGTSVGANSSENIVAANNSTYDSNNMGELYVGPNKDESFRVNNFANGDASVYGNVLDNGQDVNTGTHHSDKIMLMVNIDDTSTFTYTNSGSSSVHNNKVALVGWETIRTWANNHGLNGDCLKDGWNRSFMGMDLALREGAEAYEKDGSGNVMYSSYAQAPESPIYAWDGEKVVEIADIEREYPDPNNQYWYNEIRVYKDAFKTVMNCPWLTTNANFYVAAQKATLSQTISINRAQLSSLTDIQNCVVLKEVMDGDQWYQAVINLPRLKQLVDAGYLPVNNKNLTEWVKLGKSDGYFSDWIVTLSKAKRIGEEEEQDEDEFTPVIRVMGEDLSAVEGSDFDFNDVVFDVMWTATGAKIRLMAAGGTLPLFIGSESNEVHKLFGFTDSYPMINTNASDPKNKERNGIYTAADGLEPVIFDITGDFNQDANNIPVKVFKSNEWKELTARKGNPASKFGVEPTVEWAEEYLDIDVKWNGAFSDWVQGLRDYFYK